MIMWLSATPGEAAAYVGKEQGRVVLIPSEMAADDQEIQAAYREIEEGEWLQIPDKYDLGLGKELVFRFAAGRLSGRSRTKSNEFFRTGAPTATGKTFCVSGDFCRSGTTFPSRPRSKP